MTIINCRSTIAVAGLIISLASPIAKADIYRCEADDGSITFSQTPCPDQTTTMVGTPGSSTGAADIDCRHASRFALATARSMKSGMGSTDAFAQYGGLDALSKGTINIINYVYGFRTSTDIPAERIAGLTQSKCRARSLGDVSCEALPFSYIEEIGGCDEKEEEDAEIADADSGSIMPQNSAPVATPDSRANEREVAQRREELRRACIERLREDIDRINAQMRSGYTSAEGERYRERLRSLRAQTDDC